MLWDKVRAKFTLPVLDCLEKTEAMTKKVKHFALKKMAEQFNKWKNRLYRDWVDKKKVPDFTGTLERQRPHWKAFLEYKGSEKAKERSEKNKENAAKKKYHHRMGAGGYISAEPKWGKIEAIKGSLQLQITGPVDAEIGCLRMGRSMTWKQVI